MTAPEVPATSDPKRYSLRYGADGVEFATAQEAMEHPAWGNQDNMLVPVPATNDCEECGGDHLRQQHEIAEAVNGFEPAEVPADEGTLRERLAHVIEAGWGNPTWDGKTLRPIDRQIADAVIASEWLATELQKARAEERLAQIAKDVVIIEARMETWGVNEEGWPHTTMEELCNTIRSQEPPTGGP